MMRHRLDLGMQHRVIDKAFYGARLDDLVAAHVGTDVINRLHPGCGEAERYTVGEITDRNVGGAERRQCSGVFGIAHQSAHGCGCCGQCLDDGLTGLAGGAGDQDHCGSGGLLISSNKRDGLSGISLSSIFRSKSPSAFSIACANNGPTGMAPASPAPLMPSGLSGDVVTVWAISMCGTSSAVGSR